MNFDHTYANDPSGKQYSFVVTRAVRLGTGLAEGENYDPYHFVLREIDTGKEQILPPFWAYGKSNTERGGQFPLEFLAAFLADLERSSSGDDERSGVNRNFFGCMIVGTTDS